MLAIMKIILLFLLVLSGTVFGYPISSSDSINQALWRIYHLPEGQALIEQVEKEGSIYVYYAPFKGNSSALWNGHERSIVINSNKQRSFGELVRSIFFELHNAAEESSFNLLDSYAKQGQFLKDEYVEAVERLEHQNAVRTASILEKGVRLGLFPVDAKLPVLPNFNQHFKIQKQCGHSSQIAAAYDCLTHACHKAKTGRTS